MIFHLDQDGPRWLLAALHAKRNNEKWEFHCHFLYFSLGLKSSKTVSHNSSVHYSPDTGGSSGQKRREGKDQDATPSL